MIRTDGCFRFFRRLSSPNWNWLRACTCSATSFSSDSHSCRRSDVRRFASIASRTTIRRFGSGSNGRRECRTAASRSSTGPRSIEACLLWEFRRIGPSVRMNMDHQKKLSGNFCFVDERAGVARGKSADLGAAAVRHAPPNKRAGDSEVRNALVQKRFRSLFRLETLHGGHGPDVGKETGSQAAGRRSGKNGFDGWQPENRKRLFRQGKSVFFGVKFSSSPNRLFDMFRMHGLERAAAAIRGNGCYFGLVAGDGISAIEDPLGSSRRQTRKCRRAVRRGGKPYAYVSRQGGSVA